MRAVERLLGRGGGESSGVAAAGPLRGPRTTDQCGGRRTVAEPLVSAARMVRARQSGSVAGTGVARPAGRCTGSRRAAARGRSPGPAPWRRASGPIAPRATRLVTAGGTSWPRCDGPDGTAAGSGVARVARSGSTGRSADRLGTKRRSPGRAAPALNPVPPGYAEPARPRSPPHGSVSARSLGSASSARPGAPGSEAAATGARTGRARGRSFGGGPYRGSAGPIPAYRRALASIPSAALQHRRLTAKFDKRPMPEQ